MLNRRDFVRNLCVAGAGLVASRAAGAPVTPSEFKTLPSTDFAGVVHSDPEWKQAAKGLQFCRVNVTRGKDIIDAIAVLRINPAANRIRVFHSFDYDKTIVHTIEEWQSETSALAMINGAQYMADPYYMPCALVICDGKIKGPKSNKQVRGMLVAEPKKPGHRQADLLDFDYDQFDQQTTPYTQGVQHWPILLDRNGKIKVKQTDWQANRSVVARDFDGSILFLTTEGGFFTLYNFGMFLKESNARKDGGFRIHTAMNLDGGYEANMVVKSDTVSYVTYGAFETYGAGKDASAFGWKIKIPGVIGIFPR